ncbi:uncharacterized protein MONOS_15632 [Monocercomonoides exilis]|uniref:uncharacterized protein n=1 Tax=Monocercomonoides exilis TaxID=2049356 RepID=UPI003559C2F4|nr:hypothetical protein MONOS_15632 [Monocercomonoides exilis]|eukprot:MONOS_15632.1-p1 / transcript=MONOS_15632.1 / gene=MONOS_15632 / organism=Monocercomonoides_exilis_PA203 / gene_product=unspecified product / transcript_product=unspecified product / location=Mono_scaffold01293:5356-6191(-) / protein_length=252 / sequence_SO=supercontig / SO=protein_coding / is_pseudo=false
MDDIERLQLIVVTEAAKVYVLQTLRGYVVARLAALIGGVACAYDVALSAMLSVPLVEPLPSLATSVGMKEENNRLFSAADVNVFPSIYDQWVAVREVGEIMEKGLSAAGLGMEDVVLSPAAIELAVLEKREEAKEGEGDEMKGGYPIARREFVKKQTKENHRKLEEAMAQLVVEALGLVLLRFMKAEVKTDIDKQHSMESEVCSSSPSDGIQQDNRKAEEETVDGSLGITSDGSAEGVGKDKEQHKRFGNE